MCVCVYVYLYVRVCMCVCACGGRRQCSSASIDNIKRCHACRGSFMSVCLYMYMYVCVCVQVEGDGSAAKLVSMTTLLPRAPWRMAKEP